MEVKNDILIQMGKRIAQKRKEMGLSQEKLSELADVTPQMLSSAERGLKAMRAENLFKISQSLGVSADYLLTGDIIDKDIDNIYKKLSSVSPEQLREIEKIIDSCINLCNE